MNAFNQFSDSLEQNPRKQQLLPPSIPKQIDLSNYRSKHEKKKSESNLPAPPTKALIPPQ